MTRSNEATLAISSVRLGSHPSGIRFRAQVFNECGIATSQTATVTACPADLTCDLFVDDTDFVLFAAAYNLLDCTDPTMPAECPADMSGDGFVDDTDFVLFASAYNALLCN